MIWSEGCLPRLGLCLGPCHLGAICVCLGLEVRWLEPTDVWFPRRMTKTSSIQYTHKDKYYFHYNKKKYFNCSTPTRALARLKEVMSRDKPSSPAVSPTSTTATSSSSDAERLQAWNEAVLQNIEHRKTVAGDTAASDAASEAASDAGAGDTAADTAGEPQGKSPPPIAQTAYPRPQPTRCSGPRRLSPIIDGWEARPSCVEQLCCL